jgi:multidrug resistance efflux pump
VGRLLDLQLIQPRTPSQFLQAVRRRAKAATTAAQLQATLRLQAATRGFLARRRLQKAHEQMRDREAALAAAASTFDAEGCDLDSLDGYQQLC